MAHGARKSKHLGIEKAARLFGGGVIGGEIKRRVIETSSMAAALESAAIENLAENKHQSWHGVA